MDGFALLVEVDGVEVLSRVLPPEPVLPALPKRVVAKRRERADVEPGPARISDAEWDYMADVEAEIRKGYRAPIVIDTTGEVVS